MHTRRLGQWLLVLVPLVFECVRGKAKGGGGGGACDDLTLFLLLASGEVVGAHVSRGAPEHRLAHLRPRLRWQEHLHK